MKSIEELKEKQKSLHIEYKKILKEKPEDKREQIIITSHWQNFINMLLYWNLLDYCEKNNLDPDDYTEEICEKNAVPLHVFITEEQAEKELKLREELYKKYPYGTCQNSYYIDGIYIQKLELDILKWFLEK